MSRANPRGPQTNPRGPQGQLPTQRQGAERSEVLGDEQSQPGVSERPESGVVTDRPYFSSHVINLPSGISNTLFYI